MPRESGIMKESRVAMVGRLSQFSREKAKVTKMIMLRFECIKPKSRWKIILLFRSARILKWEDLRKKGPRGPF